MLDLKQLFRVIPVLFLLFLSSGAAGDTETGLNSILASVNGEAISLYDVLPVTREPEALAMALYPADELTDRILDIRQKAVDDLIDRKLIIADYYQQKFRVPAQEIDREMDKMADRMGCRSRSDFARKLQENGSSIEKMKKEVEEYFALDLMLYRSHQSSERATPEELYRYYEAHPEKFTSEDTLSLAMIRLGKEDKALAERLAAQLAKKPEDFGRLADEYSHLELGTSGGDLGSMAFSKLRAEFQAVLNPVTPGRVYGPVSLPDGICFLQVISFTPGEKSSFKAALPRIEAELSALTRSESHRRYRESLRSKAVIRYFFNVKTNEQEAR